MLISYIIICIVSFTLTMLYDMYHSDIKVRHILINITWSIVPFLNILIIVYIIWLYTQSKLDVVVIKRKV